MPDRYIFPCPFCGHSLKLHLKQAGQELTCDACNKQVQAPSMGGIRKLSLEGGSSSEKPRSGSGFSPLQRWLFAGGLTLAVLAGSAAFGIYRYASSLHLEVDIEGYIESEKAIVDSMGDADVFAVSVATKDSDLGLEYKEPDYKGANKQSEILSTVSYGLAGLAGLGALSVLASVVMGAGVGTSFCQCHPRGGW